MSFISTYGTCITNIYTCVNYHWGDVDYSFQFIFRIVLPLFCTQLKQLHRWHWMPSRFWVCCKQIDTCNPSWEMHFCVRARTSFVSQVSDLHTLISPLADWSGLANVHMSVVPWLIIVRNKQHETIWLKKSYKSIIHNEYLIESKLQRWFTFFWCHKKRAITLYQ